MFSVYLQWLKNDFLGYLDDWERSVQLRRGYIPMEKKMMMLSPETLSGIRITGMIYEVLVHLA